MYSLIINALYSVSKLLFPKFKVMDDFQTIRRIKEDKCSCVRFGDGEIDIIAKRANLLHFIEVKSGIGFEPVFNITPAKIAKVQKAVRIYLAKYPSRLPYCIDALIVRYGEQIEFELLENITQG